MAGYIAKFVFDRVLKESRENNEGRDDPYFETVPTKKLSTFSGKPRMKKRKKALPPGLTREDEQTLVKVKRRAYRLDMALGTCCGMKIGWGSVIGLFPAIGDVVDTMLALMVIRTASEVGLPSTVKIQMLFNVLFDFVLGLVPILGDLADLAYKANTRNALLLEDFLRTRGAMNIRAQGLPPQDDPSLGDVDVEEGTITHQPHSEPGPSYRSTETSRGYTGSRREYDVEAQRGTRPKESRSHESRSKHSGGSKHSSHGGSKHHKSSRHGSTRGHARLYSQETGTT
ncbi:hypothetical protein EDC01DRAFT_637810 [Geopyxis carbonaria]|nr:hypothetical protein EDC01DRAFT_637810 [Geopyxis carbonaria]